MNIGMLWFDNDTKVPEAKRIERAAAYYQSKYGRRPNVCFAHPSGGALQRVKDIEVHRSESILPYHYWLGVEVQESSPTTAD